MRLYRAQGMLLQLQTRFCPELRARRRKLCGMEENRLEENKMEQKERLEQQIRLPVETDKVKNIFRQTYLADGKRKENDAEHSWHLALMAVLLEENIWTRRWMWRG